MCDFNNEEDSIEEIFNEILSCNIEEGIKYCKAGFNETNNPEYLIYMGHGYLALGMYVEAIECVDSAIEKGCDYLIYGYNVKGEAQLELGLFVESRNSFKKVLEIEEDNFNATSFLVELDIREEFYEDAVNRCVDFIEKFGDNPIEVADLMSAIGWTYLIDLNKSEIALEAFEEAINNNSECDRAYTGIGIYHTTKKNYEDAINYFNKAIKINKNDGENYFGLAICYKELGNVKEIEKNLIHANLLEPMDNRIIMEYGYELLRQAKQDEAIELFEKLMEINPDDYDTRKLIEELRQC